MNKKRMWGLNISFLLIVIMFTGVLIGNYKFNTTERNLDFSENVFEPDGISDGNVSVRVCPRGYDEGNLGAWDYTSTEQENGKTVSNPYFGVIYELTINNLTKDTVSDWSAKVVMPQEGYLNSGWNGDFTVHQSVNEKEKVYQFSEGDFAREG